MCIFSLSPQSPKYMAQPIPIPVYLPFYKHIFTHLIGINLEENVQENKHTVFLSKIKNLNTNLKNEKSTSKSCYICRNTTY